MPAEFEREESLEGGNASKGVIRVGATVRKPWLATTERTVAFVGALRGRGIDVPRVHGRDDEDRLVLDFIPGALAMDGAPLGLDLVRRVGALVRRIHDASAELSVPDDWEVLIPADDPDRVCCPSRGIRGRLRSRTTRARGPASAMVKRAQAMHDVLRRSHEIGREPWGTMYVEGHGDHWAGTAKFIEDHEGHWHAALRTAPTTT